MQVPIASLSVSRSNRRRSSIANLSDMITGAFSGREAADPADPADASSKTDISNIFIDYFNSISGNASDTSTYKPCAGCKMIVADAKTSVIEMKDLTRDEILEILQYELKPSKTTIISAEEGITTQLTMVISDTVVDAVMEVSGGNPYWTNAIVKFIRDNGSNQFMKTLSSIDDTGGDRPRLTIDTSSKFGSLELNRVSSAKRDKLLKRLIAYQMDKIDSVLTHSLAYLLTHSLIHLLTHLLTYSLTH